MKDPKVCVLLATHQGQAYIRQQIASVLSQDYPNICLVLSDDGSQDGTTAILEEYATSHTDKVIHYRSGLRFGGACKHFMHLLHQFHDAPYIMFCDQDDVWHPDKVRKTMDKMRQLEAGEKLPALVHTDLRVVNQNLEVINPSFWEYSNLNGSRLKLNQLLVQNVVTGCTMMINQPLAALACRKLTDEVIMHDWWLALLASVCGKIDFLPEATIDYRQHGKNEVGAKNVHSSSYLWHRLSSASMRNALKKNANQAEKLLMCYRDCLTNEQVLLIQTFIKAQSVGILRRDYLYIKHGLLKFGTVRKAAQLLGL